MFRISLVTLETYKYQLSLPREKKESKNFMAQNIEFE